MGEESNGSLALEDVLLASRHALHEPRAVIHGDLLEELEGTIPRDAGRNEGINVWADGWDNGRCEGNRVLPRLSKAGLRLGDGRESCSLVDEIFRRWSIRRA